MKTHKKDPDFLIKPEWIYNKGRAGLKVRLLRIIASLTNAWCDIVVKPDPNGDMITIEQRLNLHHLLLSVINTSVKGDVVEFGAFEGQTSLQISELLEYFDGKIKLHLYDNFNSKYNSTANVKERLIDNYSQKGLSIPEIHKLNIEDLVSDDLPEKISFIHIDIGAGQVIESHRDLILHILNLVYPRMESGSVCLLMDYHDHNKQAGSTNPNPGVKIACDSFLKDKTESIVVPHGGYYSHAYFRKD